MRADHFETLWDQYYRKLLSFIRGRVPDEAQAEDILQEVFLRVHRDLCCLEAATRIEGWIYRVTRNLIIDHYRARRPTTELPEDPIGAEDAWEDEDPRIRLAFSLMDTINELPPHYREALILTEYENLSQAQLARRVGISLSGAKSRVQRAREKLRQLLLECCHFELDRQGRIISYHERCCCCNPAHKS